MFSPAEKPTRADHLRTATPWAIVGLALVAALGVYFSVVDQSPLPIDNWWHDAVSVTRGSVFYAVAVFMANVGGGAGAAACTAIAAALLLVFRRPRDAAAVATAMLLGIAGSELTKHFVLRSRPWDPLYVSNGSSYPSGHTMGAAALAISLALVVAGSDSLHRSVIRWAWVVAVAWVAVMAWSRTALHVHWLSDTLAGAVLGACAAILARRLWFGSGQSARSSRRDANVSPSA